MSCTHTHHYCMNVTCIHVPSSTLSTLVLNAKDPGVSCSSFGIVCGPVYYYTYNGLSIASIGLVELMEHA